MIAAGRAASGGVEAHEPRVLRGQVDAAVGSDREVGDRAIELRRDRRRGAVPRPGGAGDAIQGVDPSPLLARPEAEGAAVGREARARMARVAGRELPRLAPRHAHLEQVRVHGGVGGRVAVGRGHEDDGRAARGPDRGQVLARALSHRGAEPRLRHELRARQEVARGAAAVRGHGEHVRLGVVEPAVPAPDGEAVVDAHLRSGVLALGRDLAVGLRVGGAGIDAALVEERPSVRTPAGRPRRQRRGAHPARLAPARHVEDVDLRHLVVLTLGREGQAAAVRAPRRPRLASPARGQAARGRARVGGHDPEVRDLLLLVVRGLGDGDDHPSAVGRDGGGADALHHPDRFVRDGLGAGGEGGRGRARGGEDGEERDPVHEGES